MHVRDRRVPAGQHRFTGGALHRGADQRGGVARARADRVLPRRSGLHRGVSGALADRDGIHHPAQRSGHVRRHRPRGGAVRLGARRAGRPVVAIRRDRHLHRYHALHPARAPRRRAAARDRRAGRRAHRRHHPRPGPAADRPARRRRPDPIATADAGRRRPHPAPGGALPVTARHRARCRRAWPPGRRPHAHARPSRSGMDAGRDLPAIMDCRSRKRVSRALARRRDRQPHDPAPR